MRGRVIRAEQSTLSPWYRGRAGVSRQGVAHTSCLLRGSVIAGFGAHAEFGQAAWRIDLELNFTPPAIFRRIGRPITDHVLVFQLNRNLLTNVFQLGSMEGVSSRHLGEIVDQALGAD